jgi:hypothetical protein
MVDCSASRAARPGFRTSYVVPKFSRIRLAAGCVLMMGGNEVMLNHSGHPLFWGGFVMGALGLAIILREVWIMGFHDGVRSVPLDGAGLASGDERAFQGTHRWNPELGAWARRI